MNTFYGRYVKRILDLCLSVSSLMLISPLLLIVGILLKLTSIGPIIFVQERVGRAGKIFKIYKFRTMTNKVHIVDREIFKGDTELTKLGYWLRRFKIDELPQLFNVILGQMSIVGPRPNLSSQINEYDENGQKRLKVRPGLTGLAQVNGNIYLDKAKRWKFDAMYVENISLYLDINIILKTILIIICGEKIFFKTFNDRS